MLKSRLRSLTTPFLLGWMLLSAGNATALPVGEQILNGDFGSNAAPLLTGWTVTGTANPRASTDAMNTTGGNAGFNSFFSSAFAVLGDMSGDITGAPDSDTHRISQTFMLPIISGTYDLTISFRSVFDGDDRDNVNQVDLFTASLNSMLLGSQNSFGLPDCGPNGSPCTNVQLVQNPFSTTLLGLPGGSYTLSFQLAENNNAQTNTAVGIDNVSVTGQANVTGEANIESASIPEASSLLLFGSGLIAAAVVTNRRR